MSERTREWKSSSQASRYRSHPNSQQSGANCLSNRNIGVPAECEEGLTYIIENAFEHRPRSLLSKYTGSLPETQVIDDDFITSDITTYSGDDTFDKTLESISTQSKRGTIPWNRSSSFVTELNVKIVHYAKQITSSIRSDSRNMWRYAFMFGVSVLVIVSLAQNYKTQLQQNQNQNLIPRIRMAQQSYQQINQPGQFFELDYGNRKNFNKEPAAAVRSDSLSQPMVETSSHLAKEAQLNPMLTKDLLTEVRSSVRDAAYYDSSSPPLDDTTGRQGTSSLMSHSQQQRPDGIFLMPPTGVIGSSPQTYQSRQQQPKSVMQYSNAAVASTTASTPPSFSGPDTLNGFKDTWDPHEKTDIPVFWHVPKAGGSTIKDIIGTCHRKILASEAGITEGHGIEDKIAIVQIGGDPIKGQEPSVFVNVDTTTVEGLERAKKLGLAQSGLAETIVTTYVHEVNSLFDPQHRGRLFAIFRHPVDRAVSLFHYLKYADWEPTYTPDLAKMSIEEYAKSGMAENNWLTRTLAHKSDDAVLTDDDLQKAVGIVRRKFLVGLLSEKDETMERVEKYFGWKFRINPKNQEICRAKLLGEGANANSEHKNEKPLPGTLAYDLLASENLFDLLLYKYISTLFVEQAAFFNDTPDGFRLKDATCCKCEAPPTC